jgi:hypothetical protein
MLARETVTHENAVISLGQRAMIVGRGRIDDHHVGLRGARPVLVQFAHCLHHLGWDNTRIALCFLDVL